MFQSKGKSSSKIFSADDSKVRAKDDKVSEAREVRECVHSFEAEVKEKSEENDISIVLLMIINIFSFIFKKN
jgi:hypothetical protein